MSFFTLLKSKKLATTRCYAIETEREKKNSSKGIVFVTLRHGFLLMFFVCSTGER